jgi:predicted phosphodiesterase
MAGKAIYTDQQIHEAIKAHPDNFVMAARVLGCHESTVRRRAQSLGIAPKYTYKALTEEPPKAALPEEPLVYFPDKKAPKVDWEEVLERHGEIAAAREANDPKQLKATIDLTRHSGPIAIVQMSDVHIGSPQCDVTTLINHIKLLKAVPNLYCLLDGDFTEWAISPRMLDAVLGQVGSAQEQVRVFQAILADLASKVVAMITGNHDERGFRMGGIDVFEFLYNSISTRGVYLRDGGTLRIKMKGDVEYTWRVYHGDGLMGNSMYSRTAAMARNARHEQGWADVQSAGHTHDPEAKMVLEPRAAGEQKQPTILLRSGTYKVLHGEQYVDRMGYNRGGAVYMPAVVFWPEKKRMIPFMRVEDAVEFLDAIKRR